MMKIYLLLPLLAALNACSITAEQPEANHALSAARADETGNLIIFYDRQTGGAPLLKAIESYGATLIYHYKNLNGMAVSPPKNVSAEQAAAYFAKVDGVLSVQPDRMMQLH